MLSVAEAKQRLLDQLPICQLEIIELKHAPGRVIAEDIVSDIASPRFDNSSMDGFAVKSADLRTASETKPVVLQVVGDIPAGTTSDQTLRSGQTMRIMTGAALPPGADSVVPVEHTDAEFGQPGVAIPAKVQVKLTVKQGQFVRLAGEDFKAGDGLIGAGTRIRAQEAGLLALLGKNQLPVFRRPHVAILSSGDELQPVDQPLIAGKLRETNSISLFTLVESCGGEPIILGIARDNLLDVTTHLDKAVDAGVDLILSSAGVSVGAFDFLREAVVKSGSMDFWKVNMRPGKPFAFGNYRGIPYIGLPGNPVSSFVGFEVFLRPALNKMAGVINWSRLIIKSTLMEKVTSDGRESFLRVHLDSTRENLAVHLTGHQGSGNLYSLVQANALMRVPAGVTELSVGSQVEVWPL